MKFSKISSLLLVPLLLFSLALPAYADGESTSYLIYFETGGGTGVPIITSTSLEGKLTFLPTPAMSGYTFEGWYTDELDGDRITSSTVFTADSTIYAHWQPNTRSGSSSSSVGKADAAAPDSFSSFLRTHAGTFLVAGTMFFTLVALYAR